MAVNPGGCLTSRADCVVHEDTICQSQDLPGVPGADEETRTHRGRIPALEVHRVQPDHHGTTGRLSGPDRADGPGRVRRLGNIQRPPVQATRRRKSLPPPGLLVLAGPRPPPTSHRRGLPPGIHRRAVPQRRMDPPGGKKPHPRHRVAVGLLRKRCCLHRPADPDRSARPGHHRRGRRSPQSTPRAMA